MLHKRWAGVVMGLSVPLLCGAVVLLRTTPHPAGAARGATVRDTIPPDVLERAAVARAHMGAILQGIAIYANDNNDALPPHLWQLYPQYVPDPLAFWHPGDGDPPPTTIDNDVPNAPNSALISFEINPAGILGACTWVIRDNSAENNGGYFVQTGWQDGFEAVPPIPPYEPATVVAAHRLQVLAWALKIYTNDNDGYLPLDLRTLIPDFCLRPRGFWHPGDSQPQPTQITNSLPNALDSTQISFDYLTPGQSDNWILPTTALLRDNDPAYNHGLGRLEIRGDFQTYFVADCLGDATGENTIDLADAEIVAANLEPDPAVTVPAWEPRGNLNNDDAVDLRDLALLQTRFMQSCPP